MNSLRKSRFATPYMKGLITVEANAKTVYNSYAKSGSLTTDEWAKRPMIMTGIQQRKNPKTTKNNNIVTRISHALTTASCCRWSAYSEGTT